MTIKEAFKTQLEKAIPLTAKKLDTVKTYTYGFDDKETIIEIPTKHQKSLRERGWTEGDVMLFALIYNYAKADKDEIPEISLEIQSFNSSKLDEIEKKYKFIRMSSTLLPLLVDNETYENDPAMMKYYEKKDQKKKINKTLVEYYEENKNSFYGKKNILKKQEKNGSWKKG